MRKEVLIGVNLNDEGITLEELLNLYLSVDLLFIVGVSAVVDYLFEGILLAIGSDN